MEKRIGAQLYTVRDFMKTIEDFDRTCRRIHEIGYQIVQISGTNLKADEMKTVLDQYHLEVVTTHRSFDGFLENLDEIIAYNQKLGCKLCGIGSMPWSIRANPQAVNQFIRDADRVSGELKQAGMLFGYHHHSFEFAKLDGVRVIDRLIHETDPEAFFFILDTYWLQVGGVNAADCISGLGKRAMAVHFKDLSINPEKDFAQEMAEVGQGNLDWDGILNACQNAGAKWALVEQDTCNRDPFESLQISYEYLINKGFV